ncbi:MAG: hypothetical protein J7L11_08425 [Thermoprotei archaeon]|nr:hypothetical protein [Thermoprotei archaeon]
MRYGQLLPCVLIGTMLLSLIYETSSYVIRMLSLGADLWRLILGLGIYGAGLAILSKWLFRTISSLR